MLSSVVLSFGSFPSHLIQLRLLSVMPMGVFLVVFSCLRFFELLEGCLCASLLPFLESFLRPPLFLLCLVLTCPWFLRHCYLFDMCLFLSYFLLLYFCIYFSIEDWNPLFVIPIPNGISMSASLMQ
jgi:hypothetical protein